MESRMCFSVEASVIAADGPGFIGLESSIVSAQRRFDGSPSTRVFGVTTGFGGLVWLRLEGNIEAALLSSA